ncbi:hypothetical protein E2C01_069086 [Portunus trituberculatus]|uniref:Uncharacterized protein n=1 Tax=Portunus trituberculatus TaxID=210409 RepID=A0A5B7HTP6_PORTR|nr:hypothetical protein [Portunus trituberculatus]
MNWTSISKVPECLGVLGNGWLGL